MHKTRLAIGAALLGAASMANVVPDPRQGREIRTEVQLTKRQKDRQRLGRLWGRSQEDAERKAWNDKVDASKRQKNIRFERRKARTMKKKALPVPSNRGATVIGDLIYNYQVHSNNVISGFTTQRAKEFKRRVGGRSVDGIKAEAEHLSRARAKHTNKVSDMISGRTLRVILALSTLQQGNFEARRAHDWTLWVPLENGIWQYQVHDEVFPYFMFNDEAGDMFEFDPAKLHFSNADDANQAMHLYVKCVNARHGAGTNFGRPGTPEAKAISDTAEWEFNRFLELHGHTLQAAENTISADEAGDENYALEG